MRYFELIEGRDRQQGSYSAQQARDIGSCAVVAIAEATGKSWEEVWEVAKPYFTRYGLHAGHKSAILRELGFKMDSYYKMPWMGITPWPEHKQRKMNVKQAEAWLNEHDPSVVLICSINVEGIPHAICYKNGKFHNVLDAYRAQIRLASQITPV